LGSSPKIQRSQRRKEKKNPKKYHPIIPETPDITISPLQVLLFQKYLSERGIARNESQFLFIQTIWIMPAISRMTIIMRISRSCMRVKFYR
jgi:hypothetical protein